MIEWMPARLRKKIKKVRDDEDAIDENQEHDNAIPEGNDHLKNDAK